MDAFARFFDSQSASGNRWSYNSSVAQTHYKQVSLSLCFALTAAAAVGAYLHILWNIWGFLTTLASVCSIFWLFSVPLYEEEKWVAAGPCQWYSLYPLIVLSGLGCPWYVSSTSLYGLRVSFRVSGFVFVFFDIILVLGFYA
ncbi:bax inhibitor 1-like isoform X1 [Olea europaea var. sylvestris]|uniref:bax inhibitor 1-like isoform X1 n=1 Tax=Olea europaea var. sylvestris TaxID=158386 RepID=UPI000C1D7420|nr:bax inhibitor 1-like isoform X1 [Olea europaea var. sylvestris]